MINLKIIVFNLFLATDLLASGVDTELKKVIKKNNFKNSELGLYIESDGKEIFSVNKNQLMVPASLTKIITAGAVLSEFPLNKKFETKLLAKNKIEDGVLNGDLCLKGDGDPSFVSEKMWYLVNEFKRNEINKVKGNILVDDSKFDDEIFDSGRDSKRVDRAFDAPISATSFNWNAVNVYIRPGDEVGDKAKIFLDPENGYLELDNNAKTNSKFGHKSIEVSRVQVNDHDKIIVNGSIGKGTEEVVVYKNISNPKLWIGNQLIRFLKERNIAFTGLVKSEKCHEDMKTLAISPSKNLVEMVSDMLKFSNNFVAEMLVKNLASEKTKNSPAHMKEGIDILKKYLASLGIKESEYSLVNVSGLTRENQFSAKQIAMILTKIQNDFQSFPEFLVGLPIAGIDGTLKNRLKDNGEIIVRAKTGYLDGVIGLAGYISRKNKSPISFVFMFNGDYEKGLRARPLFDQLLKVLSEQ